MAVIYLGGAIDMAGADGQDWKKLFNEALSRRQPANGSQWTSFDPAAPFGMYGDYSHSAERSAYIEKVNQAALRHADIMVAMVSSGKASIGTPIEIDFKWNISPAASIYVISDMRYEKSVYLRNRVLKENFIQHVPGTTMESWMTSAANVVAENTSVLSHIPDDVECCIDDEEVAPDAWENRLSVLLNTQKRVNNG